MLRKILVLAILMGGVPAGLMNAQAAQQGRQQPTMPRLWDPGVAYWVTVGAGPLGGEVSLSRQFEKSVITLHAGYLVNGTFFKGGQFGVTLGLPLSRDPLLIVVGGGPGLHAGLFEKDSRTGTRVCLLANMQLFLTAGQRFGIGVHSTLGLNIHGIAGTVCLGIQYGRRRS